MNFSKPALLSLLIIIVMVTSSSTSNHNKTSGYQVEFNPAKVVQTVVPEYLQSLEQNNPWFSSSVLESFQPIWEEKITDSKPPSRFHSAMAYDSSNDKVIIFGGLGSTDLHDTWVYDYNSNTWTNMTTPNHPPAMRGHAMVYDPVIKKVVLFGSGETWTYDYPTNTWDQEIPLTSPPERDYHSMVYDKNQQKILMFGGTISTFDTWELDATTFSWTNRSALFPIPQLLAFGASYDEKADKTIVFGGQNTTASAKHQNSTYSYDYTSNTWSLLTPKISPSARTHYGKPMGYDRLASKSVFFGGTTPGGYSDETWAFDYENGTWEMLDTIGTPTGRRMFTMVYNSNVSKFIMFGGITSVRLDQTYELFAYDFVPPRITSPGDRLIEYGNKGPALTWSIQEPYPDTYELSLNGEVLETGSFSDNQIISILPIGLSLGVHIFEISATDLWGNTGYDLITVEVVESSPPTITGPADITIGAFEYGHNITWIIEDLTPGEYNVTQNGTLIAEGSWQSGDEILVDLDSIPAGVYLFEIIVTDAYNNIAADTVLVVIEDPGLPVVSSPDDVFFVEGSTGHSIRWEVDDDNPAFYILELNNEVIRNESLVDVFFVDVDLDGYTPGFYNFTLTLFDQNNQTAADSVEVQVFPRSGGLPTNGDGGGGNFFQNIEVDPQTAAIAAGIVIATSGAFYIIRRRSV